MVKIDLSGLHHLARFGGSGGDRSQDVGPELGEAQPVLRNIELRGCIVDPRLRRLQPLLRLIEYRPGGEASFHQVVLAIEIVLRLDLLAARGVERRLRRAHAVELVLRIELCQYLIRLDLVADAALSLNDPSANAEGEVHLVFGADVTGKLDQFADLALLDGDGADRARLRRLVLGFLVAASEEQGERGGDDKRANAAARLRMTGAWSQGESSHGRRARAYRASAEGATIRETRRSGLPLRMRSAMAAAACYAAAPVEKSLPHAMQAPDVSPSSAKSELERREPGKPILDPRDGDAEDDVSSPKQKSLLAIAGSLLAEISLTKLLIARMVSIVLPAADPGPRTARRERLGRRRLF